MELKEFRELVDQQEKNSLSEPDVIMSLSMEEIKSRFYLSSSIIKFIEKQFDYDEAYWANNIKRDLQNFYGLKEINNKYFLENQDYKGEFFNLHFIFKNYEYPDFIKYQYCHENCFTFALKTKTKCSILSGIAFRKQAFLHSVILFNDFILDFNYDIIMSKDLYLKLFNFQILNEVNCEDVKEYYNLFTKRSPFLRENLLTYGDVNFCFYELVEKLKQEQTELGQSI